MGGDAGSCPDVGIAHIYFYFTLILKGEFNEIILLTCMGAKTFLTPKLS
jgi:hypothetical protein